MPPPVRGATQHRQPSQRGQATAQATAIGLAENKRFQAREDGILRIAHQQELAQLKRDRQRPDAANP
eukprot:3141705-Pyramimonas_sp.AAC.1